MAKRIIFVTGTDTGAGKTVLTALLLAHARRGADNVLAVKPFCSGSREDAQLLYEVQGGAIPMELLNPFYFEEPVAPLASMRIHADYVSLREAVTAIRRAAKLCDTLIVEGSGGLLVPLGPNFNLLHLVKALKAEVVMACRNKLGVINHTLLTAAALRAEGVRHFTAVLMGTGRDDFSSASNPQILQELLRTTRLFQIPFLKGNCGSAKTILCHADKLTDLLEAILRPPLRRRIVDRGVVRSGSGAKALSRSRTPSRSGRHAGGKG